MLIIIICFTLFVGKIDWQCTIFINSKAVVSVIVLPNNYSFNSMHPQSLFLFGLIHLFQDSRYILYACILLFFFYRWQHSSHSLMIWHYMYKKIRYTDFPPPDIKILISSPLNFTEKMTKVDVLSVLNQWPLIFWQL